MSEKEEVNFRHWRMREQISFSAQLSGLSTFPVLVYFVVIAVY